MSIQLTELLDERKAFLAEMDAGVIPHVEYLWAGGYTNTFTSCEGGEGHAFDLPTVGLEFGISVEKYSEMVEELRHYLSKRYDSFDIIHRTHESASKTLGKIWWQAIYIEFRKEKI